MKGWQVEPIGAQTKRGTAIAGIMKEKKKTTNLQKGVNRILGEAQPEQAKVMYDKIKTYTG